MIGEGVGKLAATLGALAWLAYWTGRWYKEWYFAQFGIPYEVLGFPPPYYIFGSWATISTTIFALALLLAPLIFMRARLLMYFLISTVLLGCAMVFQFRSPEFSPYAPIWKKILGSRDLTVMSTGLVATGLLVIACLRREEARDTVRRFKEAILRTGFIGIIAGFLLGWALLAIAGYAVGNYHGREAIWNGKMGTRWVRHEERWWVFVVRPDEDRNFVFDRTRGRTKVVRDADLTEWGGPVTRAAGQDKQLHNQAAPPDGSRRR